MLRDKKRLRKPDQQQMRDAQEGEEFRAGILRIERLPHVAPAEESSAEGRGGPPVLSSSPAILVLPRTYDASTRAYGNLYSNLLDYIISAALIVYILTIAGIFRLRVTKPNAERPYRAFGYPWLPGLYILGAAAILLVLFTYRASTTWPGLVIVIAGIPVYYLLARSAKKRRIPGAESR